VRWGFVSDILHSRSRKLLM